VNTLTPHEAAEAAFEVYQIRKRSVASVQATGSLLGPDGAFAGGDKLTGTAGALFRFSSGFGYMAAGQGRFQGELLCATRGTAGFVDWLSNLNVGVVSGPSGRMVHAGFNTIRKSFAHEIEQFLRGRNPSHIHCVGHSLGGALAMLNADYFSASKIAPVTLYTFGAPRTGLSSFAGSLTDRVGRSRIFRVSHMADPVPMIPIFPFEHLPVGTPGYMVGAPIGGLRVNVNSHLMPTTYLPLTHEKSWATLANPASIVSEQEVNAWMAATNEGNGIVAHSASALRMLGRVLVWIVKQTANVVVGTAATTAFTLLDRLAALLHTGASALVKLSQYTMALVRGIMRFVGLAAQTTYDLTLGFLRWTLSMLFTSLSRIASLAISSADQT
jgi:triacylglycerol lipase